MTPRVKAVIFDMDGLMLDTEPLYRQSSQTAAATLRFQIKDEEHDQLIGLSRHDAESHLARHLGPTFPIPEFRKACKEEWEKLIAKGIPLKPGLLDLLDDLEHRGIPKAVATSTPRAEAIRHLTITNLLHRFPILVAGDEVTHGKPHPEIFLTTCRKLGYPPAECAVLEDSANGIRAAVAAGTVAILVPEFAAVIEEPRAAYVCASLVEARQMLGVLAKGGQ